MKKILLLAAIFGAFALSSCGPEDTTGDVFKVTAPEPVAIAGGTAIIKVEAPAGWTVAKDVATDDWFTLSTESGSGTADITVTVDANPGEPRESKITVTSAANEKKTVRLQQLGTEAPYLNVENVVAQYNATSATIIVKTNVDWEATIENVAWITNATPTSGNSETTINLTLTANNTDDDRTATVNISQIGGELTKTITVTQYAYSIVDELVGPYAVLFDLRKYENNQEVIQENMIYRDNLEKYTDQEGTVCRFSVANGFADKYINFQLNAAKDGLVYIVGEEVPYDYFPEDDFFLLFVGCAQVTEDSFVFVYEFDVPVTSDGLGFPSTITWTAEDEVTNGHPEWIGTWDMAYTLFAFNKSDGKPAGYYGHYMEHTAPAAEHTSDNALRHRAYASRAGILYNRLDGNG